MGPLRGSLLFSVVGWEMLFNVGGRAESRSLKNQGKNAVSYSLHVFAHFYKREDPFPVKF